MFLTGIFKTQNLPVTALLPGSDVDFFGQHRLKNRGGVPSTGDVEIELTAKMINRKWSAKANPRGKQ